MTPCSRVERRMWTMITRTGKGMMHLCAEESRQGEGLPTDHRQLTFPQCRCVLFDRTNNLKYKVHAPRTRCVNLVQTTSRTSSTPSKHLHVIDASLPAMSYCLIGCSVPSCTDNGNGFIGPNNYALETVIMCSPRVGVSQPFYRDGPDVLVAGMVCSWRGGPKL